MKIKIISFLAVLCAIHMLGQEAKAQRKGFWQQKVDYTMDVNVDEKAYQYEGKMTLKYSNNAGQSLSKVYFHLYFNAFQPGSMMDYRLKNISDPDKRMVSNMGTKEKPLYQSRIEKLQPNQIGYQKSQKPDHEWRPYPV